MDCPDKAIEMVKKDYGLSYQRVELNRNSFWDKK
jgi:hypothetical protein